MLSNLNKLRWLPEWHRQLEVLGLVPAELFLERLSKVEHWQVLN